MTRKRLQSTAAIAIAALILAGCVSWPDVSRPAKKLDQGALVECAAIGAGTKRLACYDRLAASIAGSWRIAMQNSPIDGSRTVLLSLDANALTFSEARQPIRPALWIRCEQDQTQLYVLWDLYLGTYDTEILYRIDSAPAHTESWEIPSDKQAAGLWSSAEAIAFIKKLFGADQMVMEVTPYADRSLKSVFEVAGLKQAIAPLRKACGW